MSNRALPSDCSILAGLLVDYADQALPPDQTARVAAHVSQCSVCQEQVDQFRELSVQMEAAELVQPTPGLRNQFLRLLEQEKAALAAIPVAEPKVPQARVRPMWTSEATRWALRVAASVVLLATGIGLGQLWQPTQMPAVATTTTAAPAPYAVQLANSLSGDAALRLSASDRIQLVANAVAEADGSGDPAVQVLINTLNFDPNANVRLAAAGALYRLRADPRVSEAFIQSLTIQTDPNVQILLIELLVNMRERRAASQLEQLAKKRDALPIVRQQAEYGLSTLI